MYSTLALGGRSGFLGTTDMMFASFPFLIKDMKVSKRNCGNNKTNARITSVFFTTLCSQNSLVVDIKIKLCLRVHGFAFG